MREKDEKSTKIDSIINIFIYETGGVKIMPFMSSLFVFFDFNQTSDSGMIFFAFLCLSTFPLFSLV